MRHYPNLTVASWEVEYRATAGGAGRWMWRVTNTGTATAPAGVDVNLLLSRDRNVNASDHWLIYEEIPFKLEPGRAAFRDANNAKDFTIPEAIPPGPYYMAMWVDDVAEVRECDETDNLLIGRDLVELQSGKPDLVPTSWFAEWDSDGTGDTGVPRRERRRRSDYAYGLVDRPRAAHRGGTLPEATSTVSTSRTWSFCSTPARLSIGMPRVPRGSI